MISGEQMDVYRVAQEFSLGDDFTFGNNVMLRGKSGLEHKFDLILTSREDARNRIAVLQGLSEDLVSDIMEFNAISRDCGIQLKAISIDRDLKQSELGLARACNISVIKRDHGNVDYDIFGMKKLDANIGKLMKRGSVYMISGSPGTGKTALCTQFLVEGAKKGERGMIVLTDTQGKNFISNAQSFSYKFSDYYKSGGIEVMEISDRIMKLKANVSSNYYSMKSYIRTVTDQLKTLLVQYDVSRFVIDPITPLIIEDNDFINQFFRALSIPQAYTLITSGIGKSDVSVYGLEQSFVAGLIKLDVDILNTDVKKASVVKINGGGYDTNPIFFRITGEGIVPFEPDESIGATPLFNHVII